MAEPPDFAELAKRYVDLWQDHLTAIAGDPALADSMARLFTGVLPWPPYAGVGGERGFAPSAGASAAPPSPPERDRGMAQLARRLAAAEERIAALEARGRGAGAGAAKKPRRRRV
jgi:hypothetical protein